MDRLFEPEAENLTAVEPSDVPPETSDVPPENSEQILGSGMDDLDWLTSIDWSGAPFGDLDWLNNLDFVQNQTGE